MRLLGLGPIEVHAGQHSLGLGGPKPKTLLAVLLLQPRQVVSTERLVDLIWDERPPQSATALVHTYVSALRKVFSTAGRPDALSTQQSGYVLAVTPDESDLETFERHLATARSAERRGDHDEAVSEYRQALGLWRGPAFGGVQADFVRTRAAGLEEDRASTVEGFARGMLALGQAPEVVSLLTTSAETHPLREETRGLLMRALYESGRQADALAAYRVGREHLLRELGVEPGETLRALQHDILTGTLRPTASRTTEWARQVVPRLLPPDIGDFTGRADALDTLLAVRADGPDQTATPTVVISGFAGAGKSTLAVHAAHLLRERYPDGQLFADLRGSDRYHEAHEVLGRFLRALGVPSAALPDGTDDRTELYRTRVAGRRLVIVLDNARDERQVRALLPGSTSCLALITSRSRLTGLEGADAVELGFLSVRTSVHMLSTIVGTARVSAEPEAAHTIADLCGGIPLAIRTAAAKLLARPHWPLRALAHRLSDERRRLDELAVGDLAVRSSLQLNYVELDERHQRAFHLLIALDLPDFGAWLTAPLLDTSVDDAEDVVERLVELRLLDVAGIDTIGRVRYRFHDLVQLFGMERALAEEDQELVAAATRRALSLWMAMVELGGRRLPRMTLSPGPASGSSVEVDPRLADEVTSNPAEWLKSETPALVRAVERGYELGVHETAGLITSLLSSPFAARNEFDGWERTHDVALTAARQAGDTHAEAVILAGLGQLFYEKDEFTVALEHFTAACGLAEEIDDDATRAVALVGIGTVQRDRATFDVARRNLTRAADLGTRVGNQAVVAAAHYGLGSLGRDLGDMASAAESLRRSIDMCRAIGDLRGEALALRGLSLCDRARGDADTAAALSREALTLLDRAGAVRDAVYARQSLAKAQIRQRRLDGVEETLVACLRSLTEDRDRFGVALVTRTLGELALAAGDDTSARDLLTSSLEQWRTLTLLVWQARTLRDLAAVEALDEPELARSHWSEALSVFDELGLRESTELRHSDPRRWRDAVRNGL